MDFKSLISTIISLLGVQSSIGSTSKIFEVVLGYMNYLKIEFKQDLEAILKKYIFVMVLVVIALFTFLSMLKEIEGIIRPTEYGPWIILASYFVLTAVCGYLMYMVLNNKFQPEKQETPVATNQHTPSSDVTVMSVAQTFVDGFLKGYSKKKDESNTSETHSS